MTSAATATRYHAIDNLRTGMMFIVMFGHPLLPYVTVPRSFKDPATSISVDAIAVFLYAFAMQAFFVTAGFTAGLLRERKGESGLWRNRWQRIFLPLLVGYILLSPLTRGAYEFAKAVVASGSLVTGADVFLEADWLRWSKLYHLWFLLSLLLFTGLALAGIRILRLLGVTARLQTLLERAVASRWRAAWLFLVLAITTTPAYVHGAGSGTSPWMQVTMFGFFAFGWFVYERRELLGRLTDAWRPELVVAVLVTPVCAWASRLRLIDEDRPDLAIGTIAGLTNAALASTMTFALLGIFLARLNRETPLSAALGRASYWVYLVHLPIVVAAGGAFSLLDAPPLGKYLATLAVAIPLIWMSYRVVEYSPLGPIIAGRRR